MTPSIRFTLLVGAGVVLLWSVVVWLSPQLQVTAGLRELVRFGHLAALVLGFGAALTVEWFGLLWLLGRRPLSAVTQVAQGAHLPIWLGLAGLTASGMLLSPAQPTVAGTIKLGAVLLVALNGVYAARLQQQLAGAGATPRRPLLVRAAIAGGVSQLGWWSAVVIGFLAARA